jgi:hypothetical protein
VITEKSTVALRVLTAINTQQEPEEADLLLLQEYCPEHRDLPPDELACMVIQLALRQRKEARETKARQSDDS